MQSHSTKSPSEVTLGPSHLLVKVWLLTRDAGSILGVKSKLVVVHPREDT